MSNLSKYGKIGGMICAPFTPFDDSGEVKLDIIPTYASSLILGGNIGVFVNGSSGEGHLMTTAERRLCAEKWQDSTPEDFKVIVHVGSNAVKTSSELAQHAESIGAFGIGMMAPMFPPISKVEELVDFCARVASAAPSLPFYYYHIPSLSGATVPMVPFLSAASERIANFAGIKFTSENLYEYTACTRFEGGRFDILHGQDETLLAALMLTGNTGCVGGTFNYASNLYRGIQEAYSKGDFDAARKLQYKSQDLIDIVARNGGNIVCGKYIMKLIDLDMGPNRSPFLELPKSRKTQIKADLEAIGFFDFCN